MVLCRALLMANGISTLDAEWLVSLAGLPEVVSISPLDGGWDNCNVRIKLSDESEFVLKAWFANSVEEVKRVIERHLHLHSHGIPTTVPIQLGDGNFLAEKGGSAWTLLPFVEGGFLGTDDESLCSLGEVLARMHTIPTSDSFPREYRMGFGLFEEVISLSSKRGLSNPFVDSLSKESRRLQEEISLDLPLGILHGDLFPDNVIGSKGCVSAILDLEEAWFGPMCFDIMMAFVGFGWEGSEPIAGRWKALVDGYQNVRLLSEGELLAMPMMHRYATLAIACWRFWKHNLVEPDGGFSERYLEMVDRLDVEFDFLGAFK